MQVSKGVRLMSSLLSHQAEPDKSVSLLNGVLLTDYDILIIS